MDDTPSPPSPRWWLWGVALLMFLVMGFMLAVYVLPDAEIQDKPHLLKVAGGGPFLAWLLLFGIRLSAHEFMAYRIHTRNHELATRRHQWKRWANQGVSILVSARHTVPDELGAALYAGGSVPVNQNNQLIFDSLDGLPEWERRSALLSPVLKPVAEYIQHHALKAPLELYVQCPQGEGDIWTESIKKAAGQLALPLAGLQLLEDDSLADWLIKASDTAPQALTCLIFIELSDTSACSEEAASLLIASPALCRAHKLTAACRLPRPLLAPYARLPDALMLMFAQQLPAEKIRYASYSQLPAQQTEKLQLLRTEHLTACPALFDVDSALGNPGLARTAVQMALAAQSSSPTLMFSSCQGQCWLQQVIPGGST